MGLHRSRQNILSINIINFSVEQKVVHSFDSQHIFPDKRTIQKVRIGRDTKARTIPGTNKAVSVIPERSHT